MSSFHDPNISYRFFPVVDGLEFFLSGWNMTFSDTEMKELGRGTQINIHNTRSFIRAFKYVPQGHLADERNLHGGRIHIHTYTHNQHLCVQSQQRKHQNNVWNIFNVNNTDARTMRQSGIFIVNFSYNSHIALVFPVLIWIGKSRLGNPFLLFIITESQHLKNNKLRIVHGNFLVLVLLMGKV